MDSAVAPYSPVDQSSDETVSEQATLAPTPTAKAPTRSRSRTPRADASPSGHGAESSVPLPHTVEPHPADRAVPEAEIRARAYELYLARGATEGDEVADWLAAERYVLGRDGHGP